MYNCKCCNKPVEQAIEGEIICSACWSNQQKSPEELAVDVQIEHFLTRCTDCDKNLITKQELRDGVCKRCLVAGRLEYESSLEQASSQAPMCPYCGKTAVYDRHVERYFCCETVIE